jgi:septation ring formation regulator EzrA
MNLVEINNKLRAVRLQMESPLRSLAQIARDFPNRSLVYDLVKKTLNGLEKRLEDLEKEQEDSEERIEAIATADRDRDYDELVRLQVISRKLAKAVEAEDEAAAAEWARTHP